MLVSEARAISTRLDLWVSIHGNTFSLNAQFLLIFFYAFIEGFIYDEFNTVCENINDIVQLLKNWEKIHGKVSSDL